MLGEGFIFSTEKLLQNCCRKETIKECIAKNYNKSIIKLFQTINKNIFLDIVTFVEFISVDCDCFFPLK